MCDQRERLIGFVYDECDPSEREEMQRHLEACAACRTEIASLRAVREDLLAWDVPAHESVWRPFAPAPARVWWQQVPSWAMAAAAGLVVMSGAAGGVMAHALMAHPDQTVAASVPATIVTASDLLASEERTLARVRDEMAALGARVQLVSSRSDSARGVSAGASQDLALEVAALKRHDEKQVEIIRGIYNNIGDLRNTVRNKSAELSALQALILQPAR